MRHVIIGAGPAGLIAAETLRKADPGGSVALIGDEYPAPYSRMAIPYYLAGDIPEEGMLLRKEPNHYNDLGIELVNARVTGVDTGKREVRLDGGRTLPYDRLLIASGSEPTAPPVPGLDLPGVHPCWTVEDARAILQRADKGSDVVLIGAGFIGSIILNALHARGVTLTVIETEDRMVPRMMNETAGGMLKAWCERKGVRVLTSTKVTQVEQGAGGKLRLGTEGGQSLDADVVITATGVRPRVDFLEGSGIEMDQGVLVDDHLQTSVPGVYAAGDVAQGLDFTAGGRSVHAIQPTAADHGRVAGLNMAGQDTPFQGSLIMNALDTLGLVSYSFGQWQGAQGGEHSEVLDEDGFRYLRLEFDGDRLVGAITVGVWEHIGMVRGLIQTRTSLDGWKKKLLAAPTRVNEAYVSRHMGVRVPVRA